MLMQSTRYMYTSDMPDIVKFVTMMVNLNCIVVLSSRNNKKC